MNSRVASAILFGLLLPTMASAYTEYGFPVAQTPEQQQADVNFDQLVTACAHAAQRDQICDLLVELKQIGDDAVEAVKAFVPLGPAEYAALTAVNALTTGRLRIRSKSFLIKNWDSVVDFQKDGTYLIGLERNF